MINEINDNNRLAVEMFFTEMWGSSEMVVSTGTYNCSHLPGFIYLQNDSILGLITYVERDKELEIISLDSIQERKGIGTSLIGKVEERAKQLSKIEISVITTNDNLNALKFYQKLDYRMSEVIYGAVDHARKVKNSIPLIGYNEIPIHDEIKLIKSMR